MNTPLKTPNTVSGEDRSAKTPPTCLETAAASANTNLVQPGRPSAGPESHVERPDGVAGDECRERLAESIHQFPGDKLAGALVSRIFENRLRGPDLGEAVAE